MKKNTEVSLDDLIEHFHDINHITGVLFWGRSGSLLLCSLLQGHPHMIQLPFSNWNALFPIIEELTSYANDNDAENISIQILKKLPQLTQEWNKLNYAKYSIIGENQEGIMGAKYTTLASSLQYIISQLQTAINEWTLAHMIRLLHIAYVYATDQMPSISHPIMLFSIHDLNLSTLRKLQAAFSKFQLITIVRHPIKTWDAHIKHSIFEEQHEDPIHKSHDLFLHHLLAGSLSPYLESSWKAVRFEDIHRQTTDTLMKLISWIGIPWDPILLRTTADRQTWWFSKGEGYYTGVNPAITHNFSISYLNVIDKCKSYFLLEKNYDKWKYPLDTHPIRVKLLFYLTFWLPPAIIWHQTKTAIFAECKKNHPVRYPRIILRNTRQFLRNWKRCLIVTIKEWTLKKKKEPIPLL